MDQEAKQEDKLQVAITSKQVLNATFHALERELRKEPLSPERVAALAEVIKALSGINPHLQF